MKRHQVYLNLLWQIGKTSLVADLEYRVNFIVRIVIDLIWYSAQLLTFEVIFSQTPQLSGWTVNDVRVFLGVVFVVDSVFVVLFHENLDGFSEKIRKGDLDLVLAKPVSSQFLMSCQRIGTPYLLSFTISLSWLLWSLTNHPTPFDIKQVLWLGILVPSSVSIIYCIRFIFSVSALILTRAENVSYLWYHFYKVGLRPHTIYPNWLKLIILSVLPMAFIASVPTEILLGRADPIYFLGPLVFPILSICITHWLWNKALQKYSSASS